MLQRLITIILLRENLIGQTLISQYNVNSSLQMKNHDIKCSYVWDIVAKV